MGEVNFYLKKPEANKKSLIYLQFRYNGEKLVFSFGQNINPKHWNSEKQRVKSNAQTTADGKYSLNDLLDNLETVCKNAYNHEIKNGVPTPATLRKYLVDFMNQNNGKGPDEPTLYKLIERFKAGEIKFKGKKVSEGSTDNYNAVLKHLKGFESSKKYKVDFDTITLDFFYKYVHFLENDIKLAANTIAKDIRLLKRFMGEAIDLGYTSNLTFKHKKFSYSDSETDAVYLTEKEIISLYRFDFGSNKRLEQVRDLFVFGSFVGLRFSDYSDVKPENIVQIEGEHFIKRITKKTNDLVIIPCNPVVLDIFNKYTGNPNRLPKSLSNQKFNDYIKEACKAAGFTERGRLATAPELELWQCISSHTARRSFATNYYLEGFPTIDLMSQN